MSNMLINMVGGEWQKIKHYYRDAIICLAIFAVSSFAGYLAVVFMGGEAEKHYEGIKNAITGGGMPENMFSFILSRNATVSFLVLVLGIFTYSAWPVLVLVINGAIGGFVVKFHALLYNQYSFEIWLFGILPHGVPELSALFLAAGSTFYYRRLRRRGQFAWSGVMKTYLLVVLPLLFLAALVETYVTPHLIGRFLL